MLLRRGGSALRRACQTLPSLANSTSEQAQVAAAAANNQQLINLHFGADNQGSTFSSGPRIHSIRHFSLFSGSNKAPNDDTAKETLLEGDDQILPSTSSATAAASATATSVSDTTPTSSAESILESGEQFTPASILDAASSAEASALLEAAEGAWAPTRALMWILESVHSGTGLAWWQSIVLTTAMMRVTTFPLMLMQIKNTHRLSQARPEIERLLEHLKEEQARGNQNAMNEYQQRVMHVWQKYNANPMKSLASLFVQAPLFIGFFSALRALAATKVPSYVEGGGFWFHDLTVPDPYYALPVLASATFLLTIELGAADGMEGQPDKTKAKLKNIMRGVGIIILPFTLQMPAGVFMYWITSNVFSLGQTMLLKVPGMKEMLGIPIMKRGASSAAATTTTTTTIGGGIDVADAAAGATLGKPVPTYSQKPVKKKKSKKLE